MAYQFSLSRLTAAPQPQEGFIAYLRSRWTEYRLLRSIEAMPYELQKDFGFPAAGRSHDV